MERKISVTRSILDSLSQSPRSGRQHKAWGANPRIPTTKEARARETGDSAAACFAASKHFSLDDPGACAPGFMPSPASQAFERFIRPPASQAQSLCIKQAASDRIRPQLSRLSVEPAK